MACDLSAGRLISCKDNVGGIKNVYFVNYGDLLTTEPSIASLTADEVADDTITGVTVEAASEIYKYELIEGSSFNQNVNSSIENGTTFFEQVLELMLPRLSAQDQKEIKVMTWARPQVIIEDNNGHFFLAGLEHGMSVTAGTIATGAAMGDMAGYTITLTGRERMPAPLLASDPETVGFTVATNP